MAQKILDRSASVIAVDSSAPSRQLLVEVIKSLGFENVQGMSNIKDVLNYLETEDANWIICPFEGDAVENGLSLLQLCTQHPELRSIRVSILASDDEKELLPSAFEFGALSWHQKPFTKDTLTESLTKLLDQVGLAEGNSSLIAAHHVRPVLDEQNQHEPHFELERNLLHLLPGNAGQLIEISKALVKLDRKDEAFTTLNQAKMIDADLTDEVDKQIKELGLNEEPSGEDSSSEGEEGDDKKEEKGEVVPENSLNILGVKTVVVVDPDDSIRNGIKDILTEVGVPNIEVFGDGVSAAKWIKENPNPDLVIQEWRIPKLSGPIFCQRIINEGATSTPIIVISSLVQLSDVPIVKEMGINSIINKPFDKADFLSTIIWTLQQDRSPSELSSLEIKIKKLIKAKKKDEAAVEMAKYMQNDHASEGMKKLLSAEWEFFNKNYIGSRDQCIEAIKLLGDSVALSNLLGKSLIMLQDYSAAVKSLEKAQELSPQNIERLCTLAESHSELGDTEATDAAMSDAIDLDPDSDRIKESQAKVAMNNGDEEGAKAIMENLDSLQNILSYMNSKAVALTKANKFDEGVSQYQTTISSIPEAKRHIKSLVYYNLALAHTRAGNYDEALSHLGLALLNPTKKIRAKATSLRNRLKYTVETGQPFKFAGDNNNTTAQESNDKQAEKTPATESFKNLIAALQPAKGEIGCYLLFNPAQSDLAKKMLAKTPKYTARDAIEREETFQDGHKKAS